MKYLRLAAPWLFAAAVVFVLWKYVAPLFKPEPPKTDVQTASVRRGDLRQAVPSDGTVTPAVLVEVKSKASGVVQKLLVEPGDQIKTGDVIAELDRKDIEARLREARAGLESSRASYALARRDLSPQQRASAESAVRQAEIAVSEAKTRLNEAELNHDRMSDMFGKGYATQAELDAAQVSLDTARQAVSRAQETLAQSKQQLTLELAGGQPEQIAVAKANVDRAQAQVDNVQDELSYTTVRAPITGTVLTRPVEIGSAVASGTTGQSGGTLVATIGDLSTLYVKAKIEEADLGRIKVGLPTRITFDAYAGWLWIGTVKKIYPQGENSNTTQGGGGGSSTGTRFPVDIAIDLKSARMDSDSAETAVVAMGGGGGSRRPPSTRGGQRRGGGGGGRSGASTASATSQTPGAAADVKVVAKPNLLPQLTASVEIVLEDHPDVVIVPAQYVKFDQGKAYVEVAPNEEEPSVREKREVELGFSDGLRYEVKDGVEEGETVVLERVVKEDQRF
ncbi:MAG: HlyD family efflux transporter periplasmic adaptor subunit [bacterium]|nr:HlyD family efflux transporter periplasmic adaptor subunit [bacterium]